MEALIKELLEETKRTNELLSKEISNNEKELEMLTIKDIVKEFDIGESRVQKMFKDPELPVQRYTAPFKVMRKHLIEYFSKRHDYLCER